MIDRADLAAALRDFFPRQRWFARRTEGIDLVTIDHVEVLQPEWPVVLRVEAGVAFEDGEKDTYQIILGLRPPRSSPSTFEGQVIDAIGDFDTAKGKAWAYDALTDVDLALELFGMVAPDSEGPVSSVRPMGAEQSHTSLVYDERVVLKVFRKLTPGRNPEVEITKGLNDAGFKYIAELITEWKSEGFDLGLVQRFLAGGVEGRAMAVTSIRDHYNRKGDPAEAGGDFAAEAQRMGQMTGELHVALAKSFGVREGDAPGWAELMKKQLERAPHPRLNKAAIGAVFDRLSGLSDPGPAMRVHGDFHLGQVMRTDAGWFVFDFEGEPARPLEERALQSSPLKDVAGMLRSFHYAAWTTLTEQARGDGGRSPADTGRLRMDAGALNDEKMISLANAWVERNRHAYLEGYVAVAHQHKGMLPPDTTSFDIVLQAFELDKAVYEVGYEMSHRPDWVDIPLRAVPTYIG